MFGKRSAVILFAVALSSVVLLTQLMDRNVPGKNAPASGNGANLPADPDISRQTDAPRKLKVIVSMSPDEFFTLQKMNQVFERQHAEITVTLENITDRNVYARMKESAAAGLADIFLLDNAWVSEFAALGLLAPEPEAVAAGNTDSRPFDQLLAQVKWNGFSWGIPKEAELYVLIWSKKAFSDNRIGQPPQTPAELLQVNQKFAEANGAFSGIYVNPADPYAFLTLAWYMRAQSAEDSGAQAAAEAAGELGPLASLYFPDGKAAGILKNYYPGTNDFDPWELLASGEMPMMVGKASDYLRHLSDATALQPFNAAKDKEGDSAPVLTGKSYVVSAYTDDAQTAFSWIYEAVSAQYEEAALQEAQILPALQHVFGEHSRLYGGILPGLRQAIASGVALAGNPDLPAKLAATEQAAAAFYAGGSPWPQLAEEFDRLWQAQAERQKPQPAGNSAEN